MDKTTSISSLISYGYETFKKNWQLLVGSYLIVGVLVFGLSFYAATPNDSVVVNVSNLIGMAVNTFVTIGLTMVNLKLVRGQKANFEDLYRHYSKFLGVFVLNLLLSVIIIVGVLLLIIPGVYLALKYAFSVMYKIDKDVSIKEAFSKGGELSEGVKMKLLGFFIVLGLLNFVGVLFLGVGLLITAPISALAVTKYYTVLLKSK